MLSFLLFLIVPCLSALKVGVHPGHKTIDQREAELGQFDFALEFAKVGHLNYEKMNRLLDQGREVSVCLEFVEENPLEKIVDGVFDETLMDYASFFSGRPVSVRPLHEANGNWYPWGSPDSPGLFVRAWRHVWHLFRGSGVQFMWHVNASMGTHSLVSLFPGDPYVDGILVSCYNRAGTSPWHHWQSFADLFEDTYLEIKAFTSLPLGVGETGSTSHGGNKAEWIRDAFRSFQEFGLSQVTWFLENKTGGRDWDLNSEEERQAFMEGLSSA